MNAYCPPESRCLQGLDVIVGDDLVRPQEPRATYEGRQHMGPGGMGWSAHGEDFWNKANFWGDWWPYGEEVDIDDVVGDVIAGYDLGVWRKQMNSLKQVPVSIALVLLKYGQQAIDYANQTAAIVDLAQAQIPFTQKLPGATRRAEVTGKLRWHKDQLATLAPSALSLALTGGNPEALKANMAKMSATYVSGSDLREWVLQSFIEANAVREGVSALSTMWDDMWTEIIEALKKLPVAVAKAAGNVVKEVQWYAKAATWLIIGGGVLALGIIATGVGLGVSNRISGK